MRPAGKFLSRMLAAVLGGQALVIFFGALVARGMARDNPTELPGGLSPFVVMSGIAVIAVLAAGMMRRPGGPALGWVVQALTLASAVWVPTMIAISVVFVALYGFCHYQGRIIDARMVEREAEWRAQEQAGGSAPPLE